MDKLVTGESEHYFFTKNETLINDFCPKKGKDVRWTHRLSGPIYGALSALYEIECRVCSLFEHAYKGFANVVSGEEYRIKLGKKQLRIAANSLLWTVIALFRTFWTVPAATIRMAYDPVAFREAEIKRLGKCVEETSPEEYADYNKFMTEDDLKTI